MPRNVLRINHRHVAIALSLGVGFAGCSLQSFDYLSKGSGGKDAGGSGGKGDGGGGADSGGSTSSSTSQGGTAGTSTSGGGSTAAGGASTGGTSGTVGTTTPVGSCTYVPGTGRLLKPPTNSFEVDTGDWSTTSANFSAISLVQGDGHACDGSSYITCNGAARTGAWDGPAIELLSYVTPGHEYLVTVAARFNQATTLTSAKPLIMSTAAHCVDTNVKPVFSRVQQRGAYTNWVRFTSTIVVEMAGCTTDLSRFVLYLETDDTAATQSIDVDDFQILDLTQ
ncbi:MAG: carbohydrate binding domain-containing protein [Polyangiaceae bacterium]